MTPTYQDFLAQKTHLSGQFGFEPVYMPDRLFDYQAYAAGWGVRKGRGAIFADTGLGKTGIQLVIAQNIVLKANRPVLILTPLAVAFQLITRRIHAGATPLTITCRTCAEGSRHVPAHSKNYEVDQSLTPTHEWFAPALISRIRDPRTREHCEKGGLLLRAIGEGDYTEVLSKSQPKLTFSKLAMRSLTNAKTNRPS